MFYLYWLIHRGGSQAGDMYANISAYCSFLSSPSPPPLLLLPSLLSGLSFQAYFFSLPYFLFTLKLSTAQSGFELRTQKSVSADATH